MSPGFTWGGVSQRRRSASILIVNDQRELNTALRSLLEMRGYDVEVAEDGLDALDRLNAGVRPSVIVLDLLMPIMDGFRFRAAQQERADIGHIPVIVMSAFTMLDDPAVQAQLNAVAYVSLPDELGQVPGLIESIVAAQR
jgi:CheY-like chemotaxis protein